MFIKDEILKHIRLYYGISILLLLYSNATAQVKSNLEIFYSLTDSVSGKIISNLSSNEKEIKIKFLLGDEYFIFSNQIISSFQKKEITVHTDNSISNAASVNLAIDKTKVEYGEIFRDGMFGELNLERKISLSGNFSLAKNSYNYIPFTFTNIDTVSVGEIASLENESFPFTKGSVPDEPFLSSLIEPAIVLTTAAVSVILFFTIRSK